MALSISTICLVLGCLTFASRSNGNAEPEKQYCGNEKFYCPTEEPECLDRTLRCTASTTQTCAKDKCFEASTPGAYTYYKKRSLLSSSKRKRRSSELLHWFVEYRGFVYEFGAYGFQELDVNDPKYKYRPGGKKIIYSEERMGSSTCTRDQVLTFKDSWLRANYHLFKCNCQHFAKQLLEVLGENCVNIEGVKAPCACYRSSSLSWKLNALFVLLILFAIFRNIN